MHVDDISAALAGRDIAATKEAFLALANYPKQEQVTDLRAGNAMTFLEAAAGALRGDFDPMPPDGCAACGLAQGASYADGAAAVLCSRQTWADHFAMIFRGVSCKQNIERPDGAALRKQWQSLTTEDRLKVIAQRFSEAASTEIKKQWEPF